MRIAVSCAIIVVKLRQRIKHIDAERREVLEIVLGPLNDLPDRLKSAPPSETAALFKLWVLV